MPLANSIKENLLKTDNAQAAMLLEAIFSTGANEWPAFDVVTILGHFMVKEIAIGQSVVRKGLKQLSDLGLLAKRHMMTRRKGRPMIEYRLATLHGMSLKLGVQLHQNENEDSVPEAAYRSVSKYRAALHRGLIARLKGQYSRQFLGERLGVSGRSTYNYEKESDIEVTPQYAYTEKMFGYDVPLAPEKSLSGRFFLAVKRRFLGAWEWVHMPYNRAVLERELSLGHEVYKATQVANFYSIAA